MFHLRNLANLSLCLLLLLLLLWDVIKKKVLIDKDVFFKRQCLRFFMNSFTYYRKIICSSSINYFANLHSCCVNHGTVSSSVCFIQTSTRNVQQNSFMS